MKRGKLHYAWKICAACFLFLMVGMGLTANLFPLYLTYILRTYHYSNTMGSVLLTVRLVISLVTTLFVKRICDRIGMRACVVCGLALEVVSRLIYAFAASYPVFLLAAILCGVAYTLSGMTPLTILINRWFTDRQGFALGIAVMGTGIAMIFFSGPITWLLEQHGLRTAFLADAAFTVLVLVVCLLLLRNRPEEISLLPYRDSDAVWQRKRTLPAAKGKNRIPFQMTRKRALNPAELRVLFLACVLIGAPGSPGFSTVSLLLSTEGYDAAQVAFLVAYFGFVLTAGKVIVGYCNDRIGSRITTFSVMSVLAFACFISGLVKNGSMAAAIIFILLFGMGSPVIAVSMGIWASDLASHTDYEKTVARDNIAFSLGALATGTLPGIFADRLGSYACVYYLFGVLTLIAMCLVLGLYRRLAGAGPASSQGNAD